MVLTRLLGPAAEARPREYSAAAAAAAVPASLSLSRASFLSTRGRYRLRRTALLYTHTRTNTESRARFLFLCGLWDFTSLKKQCLVPCIRRRKPFGLTAAAYPIRIPARCSHPRIHDLPPVYAPAMHTDSRGENLPGSVFLCSYFIATLS